MTFVTLDTIVTDILKTARGNKVSDSENISRIQIENWVHEYRALLLSRDLEKNYHNNPDYIQSLETVPLEAYTDNSRGLYRTTITIPKTIDLNYENAFTYVGDQEGNEIHFAPQHREIWQEHRKYTPTTKFAYLRDGKIYISNWTDGDTINIRGIFENPMEVARSIYRNPDLTAADWNSPYPIPNNILPTLKEMILSKELKINISAPGDTTNDSNSGVEANNVIQ
jgi:hypothetical protein